jgi:hypothetical protein
MRVAILIAVPLLRPAQRPAPGETGLGFADAAFRRLLSASLAAILAFLRCRPSIDEGYGCFGCGSEAPSRYFLRAAVLRLAVDFFAVAFLAAGFVFALVALFAMLSS